MSNRTFGTSLRSSITGDSRVSSLKCTSRRYLIARNAAFHVDVAGSTTTSLPVRSYGAPSPIVATYLEFDTGVVELWYGAARRKSRSLARGMPHTCFLIPSKMGESFVYLVRRRPGNSAGCKPSSTASHEPDKVEVPRLNRESNIPHHVIPPFSKFQPGTLFICVPKHVLYTLKMAL